MHSLSHLLEQSQESGVAIGHFNVSDISLLNAVLSRSSQLPIGEIER
jgi:fructose/tagatose bisphosphate aldolase